VTSLYCWGKCGFYWVVCLLTCRKESTNLKFSCLVLSEHRVLLVSHKWMHQFICNPILSTHGTAYLAIFYLQAWCILWNMKFVTLLRLFWDNFSDWTAMVSRSTKSWKCSGATNCAVKCIETLMRAKTNFFELAAKALSKKSQKYPAQKVPIDMSDISTLAPNRTSLEPFYWRCTEYVMCVPSFSNWVDDVTILHSGIANILYYNPKSTTKHFWVWHACVLEVSCFWVMSTSTHCA